jgi:hypothetical protein
MKLSCVRFAILSLLLVGLIPVAIAAEQGAATPRPMVETYDSLADVILASKKAEWNLVHTILASTYSHAEGTMKAVVMDVEKGMDAGADIEKLATLVAQIGNEGDASVAAIRKRLLEGGHHHNAAGEEKGIYDPGFVIVTREAKTSFLAASKSIARMAKSPDVAALKSEWEKVKQQFAALHEGAR